MSQSVTFTQKISSESFTVYGNIDAMEKVVIAQKWQILDISTEFYAACKCEKKALEMTFLTNELIVILLLIVNTAKFLDGST
jgi:hypothetical protein